MATNKFKVYGQLPASSNIFPTSDEDNSDYKKLFSKGIKPDDVAKAQDVLTPLRELTMFSVAFFNWLAPQLTGDLANVTFEDALIGDNDEETQALLEAKLLQIQSALNQVITSKIDSKEPTITKPSSATSEEGSILRGVYQGGTFKWRWDSETYQKITEVLTKINTYFSTSANKGMVYKKDSDNEIKSTDKQFVYFDPNDSEDTDDDGNYILNLKTFNYD